EDGTTVIRAAERLGIEVPHYCWHPGLSIAGNCRMCLVEIEKMPKLQIACNTRVTDGMVVHTTSEKTKTAQKAVLEFLLINHPIELAFYQRGDHVELDLAPGKRLDNPYSANVVDICPVGALTNRDFRFRARVWYLERSESVCGACANGCNMEIYHREGTIYRFQPREN